MGSAFSLDSAFNPVSQPIIAADGEKIIYANPAAISEFGEELLKMSPGQVFQPEILESGAESLVCTAKVCGKDAKTTVSRSGGHTLYYIEVDSGKSRDLHITRGMLSLLRNNLTGVKIAADRCFEKLEGSAGLDEKLVSILYHYYYRLARSIIQLDSADKLERGEIAFFPEPTNLVALCAELADTVGNLCRESDIKIIFSSEAERLTANIDPNLIELLLLNLFSNSLKNSLSGSVIDFGVKLSNSKIVLSLDDRGRGIPEEKLSGIFSPPAGGNGTRPQESIGLGLYIANKIVRLHNGAMLFEGREGEGFRVRIHLPVCEDSPAVLSSPDSEYATRSISPILTGLADVLSSKCYGPKFED